MATIDFQEALLEASRGMIRVKDPIVLLKIITRYIDRKLGATHVGVLLYDKRHNSYVLIDSKGEGGVKIPIGYIRVPTKNALVQYFLHAHEGAFSRREALVYDELAHLKDFEIFVSKKESKANLYEDIGKQMTYLKAALCVPAFYKKELIGILVLGRKLSGEAYSSQEVSLFVTLANDVAMAVKNAELITDLKGAFEREHKLFIDTAVALATAIDARDRYTHGHSERVSHYSLVLANELIESGRIHFERDFMETVQLSALLHDVGKIGIRDQILNKPDKLTPEEFSVMETHVQIGVNIVKPIDGLAGLTDGILYHHERFDGKGYPQGLKGYDIPLLGRIVNIADSFDTIVTARAYKSGVPVKDAIAEIKRCAGTQFDPDLVDLFVKAYQEGKLTKRDYTALQFTKMH